MIYITARSSASGGLLHWGDYLTGVGPEDPTGALYPLSFDIRILSFVIDLTFLPCGIKAAEYKRH